MNLFNPRPFNKQPQKKILSLHEGTIFRSTQTFTILGEPEVPDFAQGKQKLGIFVVK